MRKAVEYLEGEFKTIRTGRVSPALVENIEVSCYNTKMPLVQLATVSVTESRLLQIQPWDKSIILDIEKAIRESNLGASPTNDGSMIRVSLPPLNEEQRLELTKIAKEKTEEARISLRNLRRESWEQIQTLKKKGNISEDEMYRGEEQLNKIIEEFNNELENLYQAKEKEIIEV